MILASRPTPKRGSTARSHAAVVSGAARSAICAETDLIPRVAKIHKIQRCMNVAVVGGRKRTTQDNALRERAGRCSFDLLVEPFWVALLQTQDGRNGVAK
jgi:hypothetical protein